VGDCSFSHVPSHVCVVMFGGWARHNLLRHVGLVSSLRHSAFSKLPGCYGDLVIPHLFEVWMKPPVPLLHLSHPHTQTSSPLGLCRATKFSMCLCLFVCVCVWGDAAWVQVRLRRLI
jgi:hypothetical protein